MTKLVTFVLILFATSCKDKHFPSYDDPQKIKQGNAVQVIFQGKFKSLGENFKGHYLLWLRKNQFYARIVFSRAPKLSRVHQHIHMGGQCPTMEDDTDGNGRLGLSEIMSSAGPVLIPLDGNLASQVDGLNWFPNTDKKGRYYYSRSGDARLMLSDLHYRKEIERGFLTKLPERIPLALHLRVLVLYRETSHGIWAFACAPIQVAVRESSILQD